MTTDPEALRSVDPALLARYLSGEADREERARVERWIDADPKHRAVMEAMGAAWDRHAPAEFDPDDKLWRRLEADIVAPGQQIRSRPELVASDAGLRGRPFQLVRGRRPWVGIAAAALVTLAASLGVWRTFAGTGSHAAADVAAPREIATRRGERLTLRLADGTRVVLGPESRLRLANGLSARGRGPREVQLEGEALFEVKHDGARPFRVHTATAMAEDLGTEFVVASYPEVGGTRVAVAAGLVGLRASPPHTGEATDIQPSTTLGPGDLGVVSAARRVTLTHNVDVRPYTSWADGTLLFDGTPLREVVPALRRWYDVDLQLGRPELADMKLTATFRDEPIAQVLSLIAMSLDLTVERRGASITLR